MAFSHQFLHRPGQFPRWATPAVKSDPVVVEAAPVVIDIGVGEDQTAVQVVEVVGEDPVVVQVAPEPVVVEAAPEPVVEAAPEPVEVPAELDAPKPITKLEIYTMKKVDLIAFAEAEGLIIDPTSRKDLIAAALAEHFGLN